MIIKFTNFSNGVHEIEFTEAVEKLGLEDEFIENVNVMCRMDKSSHQIVLNCELNAIGVFSCDRCTGEFEQDLENSFEMIYMFGEEEKESEDINIHFLTSDADKIDITEEVIDYCKLAVPIKKLCDDDCKGLCTKCGANLNEKECNCKDDDVNPVWEPLMKLKDKLN